MHVTGGGTSGQDAFKVDMRYTDDGKAIGTVDNGGETVELRRVGQTVYIKASRRSGPRPVAPRPARCSSMQAIAREINLSDHVPDQLGPGRLRGADLHAGHRAAGRRHPSAAPPGCWPGSPDPGRRGAADAPYHVLDVFTDRPYAGNPLAVVLDGDDLPTESMQAIAREFNLSETTFPTAAPDRRPTTRCGSSRRAPSCRSPATRASAPPGCWPGSAGSRPAGAAGLRGRRAADRRDRAGATLTGGAPTVSDPLDAEPLLHAVGLEAGSLAGIAPPRTAGAGLEWTYLAVEADAVGRVAPDWIGLARSVPSTGLAVFSWAEGVAHLRAMTTEGFEDPATGSAALGFGVYLTASGLVPDGTTEYRIHQGAEIGRPSTLYGTVTTEGGTVSG